VTSDKDTETSVRSAEEQARLHEAMRTLFEHKISFNELIGFKIDRFAPEPVCISFDMRPELVGHYLYGRLHGGVISSVLDVESSDEIMARFSQLATLDMRVDYLRQGIGNAFSAEASVVRLGGRVAVCSMKLHNDEGTLISTGNATYMVS